MWLINSSIGRKFVMSISGAFLVLFLLFHSLMNFVVVISPDGYNEICKFLGANWYALVGTSVLAAGFVVHILYALLLSYQNLQARGKERYAVSKNQKSVEWSSQNMRFLIKAIEPVFLFSFLKMAESNPTLDFLKGFAILLVVLGHSIIFLSLFISYH